MSRLILIGNNSGLYSKVINKYINKLKSKNDIIITGKVSQEELAAYYNKADLFLCMSEHEGLCLPVLEAMKNKVPVIAYNSSAIPDTMGGAGVLVNNKDPMFISEIINRLLTDEEYKKKIINGQLKRVEKYNLNSYGESLLGLINTVNLMKNYKYSFENDFLFKNSLLSIIKNEERAKEREKEKKAQEMLFHNIDNDLKMIIPSHKKQIANIVIYGAGKVGLLLIKSLLPIKSYKVVAICDNANNSMYIDNIPVYAHKECMAKYKDAFYLISVQSSYISIIADLIGSGISRNKIMVYDNARRHIIYNP